jgi:MFS family permease
MSARDPSPASDTACAPRRRSGRWWVLAVLSLAQLIVILDSTIVNIALPRAQEALGFTSGQRQWVVTAYALSFGGLLLLGGRISDRWGQKRMLVAHHCVPRARGADQGVRGLRGRVGDRRRGGSLLGGAGLFWLSTLTTTSSYAATALPALIVLGAGMGLIFGAGFNSATVGVRPDDAGVASALANAAQQIFGALGAALLSTIALQASAAAAHQGRAAAAAAAAVVGYDRAFLVAAIVFLAAAIATTLLIPRTTPTDVENDSQSVDLPVPTYS